MPDEIIFWVLKELKTRKINYSQFLQVRIKAYLIQQLFIIGVQQSGNSKILLKRSILDYRASGLFTELLAIFLAETNFSKIRSVCMSQIEQL